MEAIVGTLDITLWHIVEITIIALEYIGVIIIALTTIRGLISYIRKSHGTKLVLQEGFSMGICFMLGSEILRTVTARTLSDIAIVLGIIVLRASLTVLLHWEMKNEKKELAEPEEKK